MRVGTVVFICLQLAVAPVTAQTQNSTPPSAPAEMSPKQIFSNCNTFYPATETPNSNIETTAIGFQVTDKGDVSAASVSRSSGDADLDSAALNCFTSARLNWSMQDQHAISGGLVATGFALVQWMPGKQSKLLFGCPYPTVPLRLQEQGRVELSFQVLQDGTVSSPSVTKSSGFADLDSAARACVANYRYTPAYHAGKPVDFSWHTAFTFGISG